MGRQVLKIPEGKTKGNIKGRKEIARQNNGGAKERNIRRIRGRRKP